MIQLILNEESTRVLSASLLSVDAPLEELRLFHQVIWRIIVLDTLYFVCLYFCGSIHWKPQKNAIAILQLTDNHTPHPYTFETFIGIHLLWTVDDSDVKQSRSKYNQILDAFYALYKKSVGIFIVGRGYCRIGKHAKHEDCTSTHVYLSNEMMTHLEKISENVCPYRTFVSHLLERHPDLL